ncbi:MAG TPA: hypothetical protein VEQ60_08180 [Longimicrobium sp.]|nr:hypothetical protein [Longimicrobium sp.]
MPGNQDGIENVQIEPLSDEDLEGMAGGTESWPSSGENCCSLAHCSNGGPETTP